MKPSTNRYRRRKSTVTEAVDRLDCDSRTNRGFAHSRSGKVLDVCDERFAAHGSAGVGQTDLDDGAGVQAQASNRHELLGSRALVVSVDGKGAALTASGEVHGVERE